MKKYNFSDFIGQDFGMIKILDFKNINNSPKFLTTCACGNQKWLNAYSVIKGNSISCGCYREIQLKLSCSKYLSKNERLYSIWREMKNRCYNKKRKDYKYYGARNITICEGWLNDFNTFQEWAYNNGYAANLTIDRINSSGNYEPSNCRWVSMAVQNLNKRNVKLISFNGETNTLKGWAEFYKINYGTFKDRYRKYKDISKCIEIRR